MFPHATGEWQGASLPARRQPHLAAKKNSKSFTEENAVNKVEHPFPALAFSISAIGCLLATQAGVYIYEPWGKHPMATERFWDIIWRMNIKRKKALTVGNLVSQPAISITRTALVSAGTA